MKKTVSFRMTKKNVRNLKSRRRTELISKQEEDVNLVGIFDSEIILESEELYETDQGIYEQKENAIEQFNARKEMQRVKGKELRSLNEKACRVLGVNEEGKNEKFLSEKAPGKRTWLIRTKSSYF